MRRSSKGKKARPARQDLAQGRQSPRPSSAHHEREVPDAASEGGSAGAALGPGRGVGAEVEPERSEGTPSQVARSTGASAPGGRPPSVLRPATSQSVDSARRDEAAPAAASAGTAASGAAPPPIEPQREEHPPARVELLRAGPSAPETLGEVRISAYSSMEELMDGIRASFPTSFRQESADRARLVFEDAEGDLLLVSQSVPWDHVASAACRLVVALP